MVINRTELVPLREDKLQIGKDGIRRKVAKKRPGNKKNKKKMGEGKSLNQRDQGIICRETRSKLNIQNPLTGHMCACAAYTIRADHASKAE